MPRKKSADRKTPEPLVPLASDGLHYVRPASIKDQHPMRFVVDQYRVDGLANNISLPRHVETAERGFELMRQYTAKACKANPELHKALKRAGDTQDVQPTRKPRVTKPKKVQFPITRFTCVMANSVAQVWICTKQPWEGVIGRRGPGGRPPAKDRLPHVRGEYAVLKGEEPLLDEAGAPKVFPLLMQAEAAMQRLFDETPGDERMVDNNDPDHRTTTVYQNRTHSVHFDPDFNGALMPFNIYNHRVHRPIIHTRGDFPLKFRTITSAIKEADLLDKKARGVS